MSDSPEAVVRALLGAWGSPAPDVDEVASFLSDDVEYFDSGTGAHHGIDAARNDLARQVATGFEDNTIEVRSLVADGGKVMVERTDHFTMDGHRITMVFNAAFEVNAEGRVTRWIDIYDVKALHDDLAAAGVDLAAAAARHAQSSA
jgi:limonene-1,2-epoxide hydrolase